MFRVFREMFSAEVRLFTREPFGMFFAMAFPILLVLLFGAIFGSYEVGRGFRFIDRMVVILVLAVIVTSRTFRWQS